MNRYYKVRDSIGLQNWAPLDCKNCAFGLQNWNFIDCTKILPHFRALKLALAPFCVCSDCELPMYLKYLQQDESPQDYLIYLYDIKRVLFVLWYEFCLSKMSIS